MTEPRLSHSNEIPSNIFATKEPISLEACHANSIICRSLSNKLNTLAVTSSSTVATTSTSSTRSLAMNCADLDSASRSVQRQQSVVNTTANATTSSTDELRTRIENILRHESATDVNKHTSDTESDTDSFDDEDEEFVPEARYSTVLSSTLASSTPKQCPICFESASLQSSPCCTFHCCSSCWRAHISASINDGRIKISCASNECNKYLARETIVNLIRQDTALHERYLKLYANANQNPRAKTCPRCSHLYSLDAVKSISSKKSKKIPKQVQCSECSLVWCFRCSAPWHENLTCKQFLKGDKLLSKWMKQKTEDQWNARKCPKCSSYIQRAGGCPHMTCSSCSCEFCYLCGQRYMKIPLIGQHNSKLSMFGCPYNFHPEKPWLRRTIRGMIATGVIVVSPLIAVGAVTTAVVVLPPVGIYKLVKRIRARRHMRQTVDILNGHHALFDGDDDQRFPVTGFPIEDFEFDAESIFRILRQRLAATENGVNNDTEHVDEAFPLAVFADMDVENLFADDNKPQSNFSTCPTTPVLSTEKSHIRNLVDLTTNPSRSIDLED